MSSRYILPFADVGSGIKPSSGAKLFFFEPDGVTPKDTFSDQLTTPTPNTNPVIADSNGVFGDIFITGEYKNTLKDKNDVQIFGGVVIDEFLTAATSGATIGGFVTYDFDTVAEAKTGETIGGEFVTLKVDDVIRIKERNSALFDVISGTGTANEKDIIANGAATLSYTLRFDNEIKTSTLGSAAGVDAAPFVRRAQELLVTIGSGKILIDINGASTMADILTPEAPFTDYVIDVQSGIEITAIPEFELLADKTKGTDNGGYSQFRIFEDKKDIKIHGFKNINGIDKDTVKGIGQVVVIRGETGVTRATNIDISDMTVNEIRNEPFRLGQTSFAGQIGENVNIWDIRVDGCIGHAVVMRSMLNSNASGLNIKNAGLLGIDISSFCKNCHLDGGRGVNTFFNTNGGAKVDGGDTNIDCSIGDYTYDGDAVSLTSFNAYTFRLMGKRAKAHDIYGTNSGGSGINMSNGSGVSTFDDMDMELENIEIDIITDGGGGSSTFNGKPLLIRHNSLGNLGVKMTNVQISNAVATGQIDANNVHGDLRLVNNDVFVFNENTEGPTNNIHLNLGLKNSVFKFLNDGTNGGSDDVNVVITEHEGTAEIDFQDTNTVLTAKAPIRGTTTRQIRFTDCDIFHVSGLEGNGTSMIFVNGTVVRVIIAHCSGSYSDGLIQESGSPTITKGLYTGCINSGAGGYVITSTAKQIDLD